MKRTLVVFLSLIPACVVESPVAEESETLEERIASFCSNTCTRLRDCLGGSCDCEITTGGNGSTVDPDCTCNTPDEAECKESCTTNFMRYTNHGAQCDGALVETMECYDQFATCDVLEEQPDACQGPPVECLASEGEVICLGPSGGGTTHVGGAGGTSAVEPFECFEMTEGCSDEALYEVSCSGTTQEATCQCLRNGEITHAFAVAPAACPSQSVWNQVCNWNLSTPL